MAHTTLILGACLGKEYGFPDGRELKTQIVHELPSHDRELRKIFDWSTTDTVDEVDPRIMGGYSQIQMTLYFVTPMPRMFQTWRKISSVKRGLYKESRLELVKPLLMVIFGILVYLLIFCKNNSGLI